ncbi:MAG: SGNH/GDSL hydrolase family protein [Propionibacteriaceae bacterium]
MNKKILTRVLAAACAALLSAATASVATAAGPPSVALKPPYVALGDSYAAGAGAGRYLSPTDPCRRSRASYPMVIAARSGLALDFQACAGATTMDVLANQLGTLSSDTAYVTLTIGGDDIGFGMVMGACLGTDTNLCLGAVQYSNAAIANVLPYSLNALFTAIKAAAPNAKVVVTGYPHLFNGENCSPLTDFTAVEMAALNAGADSLDAAIRTAATNAGFTMADVVPPFAGHGICDSKPWINNVDPADPGSSFHPNGKGYGFGYAPTVARSLGAAPSERGMSVTTGGVTSSDTARAEVRAGS